MKTLLLLLVLVSVSQVWGVPEISVRAYLLPSLESLSQIDPGTVIDPFSEPEALPEISPRKIKEPLFESRFLKPGGEIFDLSEANSGTVAGVNPEERWLQTGFFCRSEMPVILSQSQTGKKWTSLILTVAKESGY